MSLSLGGFLTSVIVARTLSVVETGEVAYAFWIIALTAAVADLGVYASLERYMPELTGAGRGEQAEQLAAFLLRRLGLASIVSLAAYSAYAGWLWAQGTEPPAVPLRWLLIGFACATQTVSTFTMACMRGLQQYQRLAALTILWVLLQLAGLAVGGIALGVSGALAGYCAGSIVPAALSILWMRADWQLPDELRKRVRRYAFYSWAGALSSAFVWSRAEVFFLEHTAGSKAVALFSVGLTLSNVIAQVPMRLSGAGLLPYFSERFGRGQLAEVHSVFATATRIQAFFVLPACFQMVALMPVLLPLIYGSAFAAAVPAAMILVAAAALVSILSVSTILFYAVDRSDFGFFCGLLAAPLTIVTGLTIIPEFGLLGAAWARAGVTLCTFPLGCWFLARRLRCPLPLKEVALIVIAAAIGGLASWGCLMVVVWPIAALPTAICVGSAVYLAAIRMLGAMPETDVERLQSLNQLLPHYLRMVVNAAIRLVFAPTGART